MREILMRIHSHLYFPNMGEPASLQIPIDEDPPQFSTPEFFQWNLELVRTVVAQAMGSMPPPQVVVNTPMPPVPSAPPAANTGIQFHFGADPQQFSGKAEDACPCLPNK